MKKVAIVVKCKRDNYTTKQSLFVGYICILLKKKHLSFATPARSFAKELKMLPSHARSTRRTINSHKFYIWNRRLLD